MSIFDVIQPTPQTFRISSDLLLGRLVVSMQFDDECCCALQLYCALAAVDKNAFYKIYSPMP
jgi:hypothetical protein